MRFGSLAHYFNISARSRHLIYYIISKPFYCCSKMLLFFRSFTCGSLHILNKLVPYISVNSIILRAWDSQTPWHIIVYFLSLRGKHITWLHIFTHKLIVGPRANSILISWFFFFKSLISASKELKYLRHFFLFKNSV